MPMTVTAGSVVVVPVIVMVVVGVMAFLSAVVVTLMVSMVMAFMIFVVFVFAVGFRHILLPLFIERHFAARRAEVVDLVIVFTLTARRVVGIHIHLANWVNRCSHSISSD